MNLMHWLFGLLGVLTVHTYIQQAGMVHFRRALAWSWLKIHSYIKRRWAQFHAVPKKGKMTAIQFKIIQQLWESPDIYWKNK